MDAPELTVVSSLRPPSPPRYRVGDGPVVQFDDLSGVNDTLTSVGYAMYRIGKDTWCDPHPTPSLP